MLVTKVSDNSHVRLQTIVEGKNEDYNRTFFREYLYLEQERKRDLQRLGKVENDITKLSLYDF